MLIAQARSARRSVLLEATKRLRGDWRNSATLFVGILATSTFVGSSAQAIVRPEVARGPSRVVAAPPERLGFRGESRRAVAALVTASTVVQDAVAIEEALGLDRSTRRMIQQGLRNEGFDPGTPDGLFGPRTRAAIRRWQEAQGLPATGYLDSTTATRLRASGASQATQPAVPSSELSAADPITGQARGETEEPSAPPERAATNCAEWNTGEFFETATATTVAACLSSGADVAARDDDRATPLHWAASISDDPTVLDALLAAGADLNALTSSDRTAPQHAARNNPNPSRRRVAAGRGRDPADPHERRPHPPAPGGAVQLGLPR